MVGYSPDYNLALFHLQNHMILARVTVELKWLEALSPTSNKTFPTRNYFEIISQVYALHEYFPTCSLSLK